MIAIEKKFKKWSGENIEDLRSYIKQFIKQNNNVKIAIGTDSLKRKKGIKYAIVIALFYSSISGEYDKGAHVLYHTFGINKKLDLWTRLWNEIEASKEVADFIQDILSEENAKNNIEIHIDINPDVQWESNKLLKAATGYLSSLGYNTIVKPFSWVAMSAADKLCR